MAVKDPNFPNSFAEPFKKTSEATDVYNCIAWAANINTQRFWPDPYGGYEWPKELPFEETLDAFIEFYKTFGYSITRDGSYKEGYIKIVIFTKNSSPTHAARQLSEDTWTSKLGENIDVSHTLAAIQDGFYGRVAVFMVKKLSAFQRRMMKGQ